MTVSYTAGFYRINEPFGDDIIRNTISALDVLDLDFLPATLFLQDRKKFVLRKPEDYKRELIPSDYFISSGIATLPLECANGAQLDFTETADPRVRPGTLSIQFSDRMLRLNGWDLETLLRVVRSVVGAFAPDYGYVYDEAQAACPTVQSRMFKIDWHHVPTALFWINYYGPGWVRNLGRERLNSLRSEVPVLEWQKDGGVLIAIQRASYDDTDPSHRQNQQRLERLLGLRDAQARFPNPGM